MFKLLSLWRKDKIETVLVQDGLNPESAHKLVGALNNQLKRYSNHHVRKACQLMCDALSE